MNGYNAPSFQDRATASLQAKQKALASFKAAPQPDAVELAVRVERRIARELREEAKAAQTRLEREERQRLADEKRNAAREQKLKAEQPKRTETELKAARDARYAARKSRQ